MTLSCVTQVEQILYFLHLDVHLLCFWFITHSSLNLLKLHIGYQILGFLDYLSGYHSLWREFFLLLEDRPIILSISACYQEGLT
uniref:Uncharacterized protein n=1 Tax=Salix viminalis TaxID=40686 RepID=A0A6N2MYG7_SALVM